MTDLSQAMQPKDRPGKLLARVALIRAISEISNRSLAHVARERYGDRPEVMAVMRSATGTADTTSAAWARELVADDAVAFMDALRPRSGYAQVAARALPVEFGTAGGVRVPYDAGTSELAGAWVGENGVIPVKRGALAASTLSRSKMGVITMLSEELSRSSTTNAETFTSRMMEKHTAQALDAHFFSDAAAVVGVNPPGIVNGIAPIAPSAAALASERAIEDLSALVTALVTNGAVGRIVIAMSTAQRLALGLMRAGDSWIFRDEIARGEILGVELVSAPNIPVGDVFAVDCENLATGLGVSELDSSREVALVLADADANPPTMATNAADRTAVGTAEQIPRDGGLSVYDPAQHAAGKVGENAVVVSAFQQWASAIRLVLPVSWARLRAGGVAWVQGCAW